MSSKRELEVVRGFYEDAMAYLERNLVTPQRLIDQIDRFRHEPDLLHPINSEIYGLRWGQLTSAKSSEFLIALDHEDNSAPLLMLIGTVSCTPAEIDAHVATIEFKKRINMAIARIISLHRFAVDI